MASPVSVPSTSTGSTQRSTCVTSERLPPSSSSIQSRARSPCGRCTQVVAGSPWRATNTGGRVRRHSRSRRSSSAAAADAGEEASTPSAASTATTVASGTTWCAPAWSQNSVATP